jgi:hypothetical protein
MLIILTTGSGPPSVGRSGGILSGIKSSRFNVLSILLGDTL